MKANPVGWFEIYIDDMNRAKAFYESVFDVRLERLPSPILELWAFPVGDCAGSAPGATGALAKMPGCPAGGNSTLVYFTCDDCATASDRVRAAGGRVHKEKFPVGEWGFLALAFDTEGNLFGLHSAT